MRRPPRRFTVCSRLAWFLFIASLLVLPSGAARADRSLRIATLVRSTVLAADMTFETVTTSDLDILDQRGAELAREASGLFHPASQSLEVIEAWVQSADGARHDVPASSIFVRPAQAPRTMPGFTDQDTVTVVFAGLAPGSKRHVKWRFMQKRPMTLGFTETFYPPEIDHPGSVRDEITAPADLPLRWIVRGAIAVEDEVHDGRRSIVAEPKVGAPLPVERDAVDPMDFDPLFFASTTASLDAVGRSYFEAAKGRDAATPEITALAAQIAGTATGAEAARRIHDWMAVHINYLAIRLDPADGWTPHAASDVLRNGYGDCKDFVTLMSALLAARGIRAEAALVDWGRRFEDLPLPASSFNHAIVHLPELGLYDNPTDRLAGFGALDRTLGGKQVVLVTASGATDRLPPSLPSDFTYHRRSTITLDVSGNATGHASIEASPAEARALRAVLTTVNRDQLVEDSLKATPEGGFGRVDLGTALNLDAPFRLAAYWESPRAVAIDAVQKDVPILLPGGFDLVHLQVLRNTLNVGSHRRTPLFVGALDATWETDLVLPGAAWTIRALPKPVDAQSAVAHFTAEYKIDGPELHIRRHLVIERNVVEPGDFPAYEGVIGAALDDSRRIVVLTQEAPATAGSR